LPDLFGGVASRIFDDFGRRRCGDHDPVASAAGYGSSSAPVERFRARRVCSKGKRATAVVMRYGC
jgi:hypothetical protein